MPFFFFMFWGFVAAFFVSGLAVSGFGWIWALKRKVRVLQWVSALVFCGLSAAVVTGVALFVISMWRGSQPSYVFEDAFHQKPPANVTVLHGRSSGFIDSAGITVAFRADRATFDRLRPQVSRPYRPSNTAPSACIARHGGASPGRARKSGWPTRPKQMARSHAPRPAASRRSGRS